MDIIKSLTSLMKRNEKYYLIAIVLFILLAGFIEMMGIASIMPFIGILNDPKYLDQYDLFVDLYLYFNIDPLTMITYMFMGFFLFAIIANILTYWIIVKFCADYEYGLSSYLINKYLSRDYSFFFNNSTATICKNILDESRIIAKGILLPLLQIVAKTIMAIFICLLLIFIDPYIFLISLSIIAILFTIFYMVVKKKLHSYGNIRVANNNIRFKYAQDAFNSIKDVKFYSAENYYQKVFTDATRKFTDVIAKADLYSYSPRYIIELLLFGSLLILILYLIKSDVPFTNFLPTLSLFMFASYRILPAFNQIFMNMSAIKYNEASFHIINEIINYPVVSKKVTKEIPFKNSITLENIYFNYEDRDILKNISLKINKSRIIGLVGKTGVGKTTILDLLLGFIQPNRGCINIDDYKLDNQNMFALRKISGYVTQNTSFIDNTLAENIAFGVHKDKIDYQLINDLLDICQLKKLVDSLPEGLNTIIGDDGVKLSGGQCQRIAIARALYRNPELLILDEGTNALDIETEKKIITSIKNLYKDITILIISHRPSSLQFCDTIYSLNAGSANEIDLDNFLKNINLYKE